MFLKGIVWARTIKAEQRDLIVLDVEVSEKV